MEIWVLVAIIIAIIIALAVLKFVFNMVKVVFWIAVILFVITSVFGIFTYRDALDMKEKLGSEPKLLFLKEDEKIVAGFSVEDFDDYPRFFTFSEVVEYQNYFRDEDYKKMLGENYKMFIFDTDAFNLNQEKIDFIGGEFQKDTLYSVLKSNDPIDFYKSETEIDVRDYGIEDSGRLKGNIFAVLFNDEYDAKGQLFILGEYKKNNVIVYPETASFKLIRILPTSLMDNFFEKVKDEAIEKISN